MTPSRLLPGPAARRRAVVAATLLAALAAGPAAAVSLQCDGPNTSLAVELDPAAGRCVIEGARASLRKPHDPVVCHLSNPRLQILTIGRGGDFIWEETASDHIVRGTCSER